MAASGRALPRRRSTAPGTPEPIAPAPAPAGQGPGKARSRVGCCGALCRCAGYGLALAAAWVCALALDGAEPAAGALECGPRDTVHLSDVPAQGMHVLSAAAGPASLCETGGTGSFSLSVWTDGYPSAGAPPTLEMPCPDAAASAEAWLLPRVRKLVQEERPRLHRRLRAELPEGVTSHVLDWLSTTAGPEPELAGRHGFFTPHGTAVEGTPAALLRALGECGTVYLFEAGNFLWPGVRVGHNWTVQARTPFAYMLPWPRFREAYTLTTLSLTPRVFSITLLSDFESQWLQYFASEMMAAPARQTSVWGSRGRTSTQLGLAKGEDTVVSAVESRVQQIMRVPAERSEPCQVLRYESGQKYSHHTDYFDAALYSHQPDLAEMTAGGKNRLVTVLWYIAAPSSGGHTAFPRAGGLGPPAEEDAATLGCAAGDAGLRVAPVAGTATVFYNLRPDGATDPFSLHAGCPVDGTKPKWAANQWLWNGPLGSDWEGSARALERKSQSRGHL